MPYAVFQAYFAFFAIKNSSIFLTNKGIEMVEGLKKMERIIEEE
jgi:hypothetical protein